MKLTGDGGLGDECDNNANCNGNANLHCEDGICKCADDFELNVETLTCDKKPGGLGDECLTDADCDVEAHLECNPSLDKCDCMPGFEIDPDTLQCV
ncbi:unnamed protein product [Darwinula stevensoni]|uniref:EGF-like domain-containing protein n=1 Tax=Darwinula stevensoni TaxID=69355 RepID=A0A7R9AE63_9CRUS|nr:unnamed protein product [Darwinula stevensoni]CAG0901760.1 unnamed protein product [Darwinula stevensoni]